MNIPNMERKNINFQNKHFLFDFDGVISQSPYTLFKAWKFAFHKVVKVDIKKEEYYLLEGIGVQKTAEILGSKYNIEPSYYQSIIKIKDNYFRKEYTFNVFKGTYKIINILKNNRRKIALVTGAEKYRILESVPKNFLDQFDILVTSDDVVNTKPNPEPYLKAAKLLNAKEKDCIVVENAPLGIQSAKNAGMFVVALETTLPKCYLLEADLILESIVDLFKFILS